MPTVAIYRSAEVTPEAYAPYERDIQQLPLPDGALLHLVGFDESGLCVIDVWRDRAAMQAYEHVIGDLLMRHDLTATEPQVFEVKHVLASPQLSAASLQTA